MSLQDGQSPLRVGVTVFLIATVVGLVIGVLGFGDALEEAATTAVGIGLGVGIVFYIFESAR
jgi:hypothetical protein